MFKKKRYLIGGAVVLLAIGFLGFRAFAGAATYYYQAHEVLAKESSFQGQTIRVEGTVVDGSVQRESAGRILKFSISDNASGGAALPVVYSGIVPDTFAVGNDAVVQGTLGSDNVFQANQLTTKCPTKYVQTPTPPPAQPSAAN